VVSFGPGALTLKASFFVFVLCNCLFRIDLEVDTTAGISCLTLSCTSDATKLTDFHFAFPQLKKLFSTAITHVVYR
jgi:hypothetical protein